MRSFVVVTIVCSVLAGCVSQTQTTRQAPAPANVERVLLTEAQMEAVKAGVRANLKDPNSAIFGSMLGGADDSGVITVCGMVNARNSFGGYTGLTPFTGALVEDRFALLKMGGPQSDTAVVIAFCQAEGIFPQA